MFLIDDDQARVFQRHENGRAGTQHNFCVSGPRLPPGSQSCAVGETRVQYHRIFAQSRTKPGYQLWRQPDLRHQYQNLFAGGDLIEHQVQIHLGLAAAGHAIEQTDLETRVFAYRGYRCRLIAVQGWTGFCRARSSRCRSIDSLAYRYPILVDQIFSQASPARLKFVEFIESNAAGLKNRSKKLRLFRRPFLQGFQVQACSLPCHLDLLHDPVQ